MSKKKQVVQPTGLDTLAHVLREAGMAVPPEEAWQINMGQSAWRHQTDLVNRLLINERYGVYDEAGCVDAETEFLSPTGWKRIDQWAGEKVMQFWPETGCGEFVEPSEYIKRPCSEMLRFKTARSVDQVLSAEHRVLTYSVTNRKRDGKVGCWRTDSAQTLYETQHKQNGRRVRTAFELAPSAAASIEEPTLRLMVAVIADAHFPGKNNRAVMRLKKQRKIDRLRALLAGCGLEFRDVPCLPEGFRSISFMSPRREKEFGEFYWTLNREQLAIVVDEAQHWDGSIDARGNGSYRFSSSVKTSADFLQYAAVATGRTASMDSRERVREGRKTSIEYGVHVQPHTLYAAGDPGWITKIPNPEGFKYCFSVPSTFLVLRRGGRVFTTGNTGKTLPTMAAAIYQALIGNKLLLVMPPALLFQLGRTLKGTFRGHDRLIKTLTLNGGPKQRDPLINAWLDDPSQAPDLLLMSYQIFLKEWKHLRGIYQGLVCDEAQALKNPETKIYHAVRAYLGPVGEKIFWPMTGTPIPNELVDAYGLISLVTPDAYASFDQFDRMHCRYTLIKTKTGGRNGRGGAFKKRTGYHNEERIQQALFQKARRVLRAHVLDIDEPQFVPMPVELHKAHRSLYREIFRKRYVTIGDQVIAANNQQRLRQMLLQTVACPHLFSEKPVPNALEEWLDQLLDSVGVAKNKVVIVSHFQATGDALFEKFTKAGMKPAIVYGGRYKMTAEKAMDLFDNDPECRVMLVQPRSGGAGLDMQKASHFMVLYEPPSTPGDLDQLVARICRGGQTEPVSVFYPQVLGTAMIARFEACVDKKQRADDVTLSENDFLREMMGDQVPESAEEEAEWSVFDAMPTI